MKIGYLGPKATFTDLAVTTMFPFAEKYAYDTIPECIDAVSNGEVELGVVPLENALEGSVNLTIDYLIHEQPLPIVGEIIAPIQQHLMVHPYYKEHWNDVREIYSHSHAIAQCHKFLHTTFKKAKYVYMTSTSAAAKFVSEHPHLPIAAIANEMAAKEYGLEIVKANIHDYDYNHTRFIIVRKQNEELSLQSTLYAGDKTTLMIALPKDQAGALHQVLSAFAWRRLNLTKIESRPAKTGLGNYFFIIDIDQKMDDVLIPGAIAELEALDCTVQVLGSYPYYII
ncbi:prephenate dehydratase [Anoxybacillus voinovskiensis]|uniref:Prephenate dehydratase n=1 Tax=Anoxybacteroides voinovskiense TaxID=230470 RepID=A0A840DNJ2_9BACL|nr:prephenate dehydratase [Anoxybacillus voinovskiensis]MBB4073243.1 prephenate dehydratase [Anoxybacillus voinovskiensis]GGJ67355.1 prephenate dehydratase [Anoxybacillus voinovskiensis]